MSLTTKQTPRGQVVVGDLPPDFLRIPSTSQQGMQNAQIANDERTARMLQYQQGGMGAGFHMPQNVVGRLSVSIAQAKLAKNYSITKMDPYCRIRVGHAVFETPTASGAGKNPHWSKTIQCYLPHGVDHAYIEIFDEKTFQVDERIAWAHVPIPQTALDGDTVDDWYPLNGKQGDGKEGMVNLIFSFTQIQAPTPNPVTSTSFNPPQVLMMPGAPGMYYPAYPPQQPVPMVMAPSTFPQQPIPSGQPRMAAQGSGYATDAVPPRDQVRPRNSAPITKPLTEDELNQIKDIFPSVEMDVIKSVADAQSHVKEDVINALLAMSAE